MKRLGIIAAAFVVLSLIAFFSLRPRSTENTPDPIAANEATPQVKIAEATKKVSLLPIKFKDNGKYFSAENQREIAACLGKAAKNMEELWDLLQPKMGKIDRDELNWKNIQFEVDRKKYRIHLAIHSSHETSSYLEMTLFQIDDNGFPDKVKIPEAHRTSPTLEIIKHYVSNHPVDFQEEKHILYPESGGEVQVEWENETLQSVEYISKQMHLGCSAKFETSCKCLAKN